MSEDKEKTSFSFNQEFSGTDIQVNQGQNVSGVSKTTNYADGADPWSKVFDEIDLLDEGVRLDAKGKAGILKDMTKMEDPNSEALDYMDQILNGLKKYGPNVAMLAAQALMGSPLGAIKEAKGIIELYIDS